METKAPVCAGASPLPARSRPDGSGKQDPATGKTKFHKYKNTENIANTISTRNGRL